MSNEAFKSIAGGLQDAIAIAEGTADPATYRIHIPSTVDVKALRRRKKMTQAAFAARYGFSLARIRDWEQHRSAPDNAARAFLRVIEREPEAVDRALTEDA